MSAGPTGWVLSHGPAPDTLDIHGDRYGVTRARGLRSVLLAVADAANSKGEHAHPGFDAICSISLYSGGATKRILTDLMAEGWLEITELGGGRGKATVYRVCMDRPKPAHDGPERDDSDPPKPGINRDETGTKPGTNRTNATPPPAETQEQFTSHNTQVVQEHMAFDPFDVWWDRYPKRRRVAEHQCRAKYTKSARDAGHQAIDAGLTVWLAHWNAHPVTDDQFVTQSTTWLNQKRWQDEPPTKIVPKSNGVHANTVERDAHMRETMQTGRILNP